MNESPRSDSPPRLRVDERNRQDIVDEKLLIEDIIVEQKLPHGNLKVNNPEMGEKNNLFSCIVSVSTPSVYLRIALSQRACSKNSIRLLLSHVSNSSFRLAAAAYFKTFSTRLQLSTDVRRVPASG